MMPMMMMGGEMWARMGSTLASFMFLWAIFRQYCPYELRRFMEKYTHRLMSYIYPYIRISVHEFTGDRLKRSEAYAAVEAYLSDKSPQSAKRLKAEMGKDNSNLVLSMDDYERVTDEFRGAKFQWALSKNVSPTRTMSYHPEPEKRYYRLTFHKRYRELIRDSYLEHVVKEGKAIRVRNRQRRLYSNIPGHKWPSYKQIMWSHVVFDHPATFQTLAMDPEKKREIVEDLLTFSQSKAYYAKIGKVWKRGYLLYGPPGTGKSTMIAAMANFLGYDVYDLELTAVKDNTELRKLLIETSNKSIIVIEDIDCSLDLTSQRRKKADKSSEDDDKGKKNPVHKEAKEEGSSKVTLSGLLNFIDGLWSACGGERLLVFTTNYVEKLDPALIRRGRMDKHIELSYCSFEGFKVLAKNYLDIDSHSLFDTIHQLLEETNITPADVAEKLMPKSSSDNADTCLTNLVQGLEEAKEEATRLKIKEGTLEEATLDEAKEEATRLKIKEGALEEVTRDEAKEEATRLKIKDAALEEATLDEAKDEATRLKIKDGALEEASLDEAKEEATRLKTKDKTLEEVTIDDTKEEATRLKIKDEAQGNKCVDIDSTQLG